MEVKVKYQGQGKKQSMHSGSLTMLYLCTKFEESIPQSFFTTKPKRKITFLQVMVKNQCQGKKNTCVQVLSPCFIFVPSLKIVPLTIPSQLTLTQNYIFGGQGQRLRSRSKTIPVFSSSCHALSFYQV